MFRPHITVATVVHAAGQLLIVEEIINGRRLWNQPAGHLEAGETLVQAAQRELWEETGLQAAPQAFLRLHQWTAPDRTVFLRFLFTLDLDAPATTAPRDADIDRCLWVTPEAILSAPHLRSPLVAESVRCWQHAARYPLTLVGEFSPV